VVYEKTKMVPPSDFHPKLTSTHVIGYLKI